MKLFHIPPGKLAADLIPEGEAGHLVVASEVLKHDEYALFYMQRKRRGDWITMDTPAFEGEDISNGDLFNAITLIQPDEVVLPDVYRDCTGTTDKSWEAYDFLRQLGYDGQFMGVAQGGTWSDYLQCASYFAHSGKITTLGIIEEVEEHFDRTRIEVASILHSRHPNVQLHFLGASEHLRELKDRNVQKIVRSCDTAKFVVWGLNGILQLAPAYAKGLTFLHDHEVYAYPGRQSLGGRKEYFNYTGPYGTIERDCVIGAIESWREYLNRCAAS